MSRVDELMELAGAPVATEKKSRVDELMELAGAEETPSILSRIGGAVKSFVAPLETMLAEAPPTLPPPPSQREVLATAPGAPARLATAAPVMAPLPSQREAMARRPGTAEEILPAGRMAEAARPEEAPLEDVGGTVDLPPAEEQPSIPEPLPPGHPLRQIRAQPELGLSLAQAAAERPPELVAAPPSPPRRPLSEAERQRMAAEATVELLRREGVLLPQTALERAERAIRPTRPVHESIGIGLGRSIEGLLLEAVRPGTLERGQPEFDSSLLDQAFETMGELVTPLSFATFLLGGMLGGNPISGAVARQATAAAVKKWGATELTAAFGRAAQAVPRTAGALATFDAVRNTLEQAGAVRRDEQAALEPGPIATATARGAAVGATLGLAPVLSVPILRKAAEVGILASAPALIEGRAPTVKDALDAGVLVGVLTATGRLSGAAMTALRKPKAQRTPQEQREVEAIPPDVQAGIARQVAEAAQKAPQEAAPPPQVEIRPPAEEPSAVAESAAQRAEAAAQRARESLARMEELARQAIELPPPAEEAAPEIAAERPAEILPAGRIAEAAPAEAPRLAEVPPAEAVTAPVTAAPPTTFRAFVESQGRRWPITVRDPDYVRLREEYDALRAPRYEKRGVEVVESATGRVVGTGRNGAEAQLLANRMNAGREIPPPAETAPPGRIGEPTVEAPLPEVPPEFGATNRLVTREAKDAAAQRIRDKLSPETLRAGVDPTLVGDLVQVGTFYFEGGVREFGAWSARMTQEFGDAVRQFLQEVWERVGKAEPAPVFRSALREAVEQKVPNAAFVFQIRAAIKGTSPEEAKWTGLDDWLAQQGGRKVAKQEVLDFLRQNEVRVEEITKGERSAEWRRQFEESDREFANARTKETETLEALVGEISRPGTGINSERARMLANRYVQGQISLPDIDVVDQALGRTAETADRDVTQFYRGNNILNAAIDTYRRRRAIERRIEEGDREILTSGEATKFGRFTLPGGQPGTYRELLLTLPPLPSERRPSEAPRVYKSPHFDEPNVLAHVRFNERTDADGAKVLFIEELQSDWHQEGRRKGYRPVQPMTRANIELRRVGEGGTAYWESFDRRTGQRISRHPGSISEAKAREEALFFGPRGEVPEAPFAKTWHELVLKRMLRWAAEKGYDKVAWTTGEQQAERYDLSKQVKAVEWAPQMGSVRVEMPDGKYQFIKEGGVTEQNLETYVGKDAARHLIEQGPAPNLWRRIEGEDLKVGGEGMRAFYDQIVPNFLRQYGKKWGARVGETQIAGQSLWKLVDANGQTIRDDIPNLERAGTLQTNYEGARIVESEKIRGGVRVPALDITPEMRASVVREGQPMFGSANVLFTRERKEAAERRLRDRPIPRGLPRIGQEEVVANLLKSEERRILVPGTSFRIVDVAGILSDDLLRAIAERPYPRELGRRAAEAVQDVEGAIRQRAERPGQFFGFDAGLEELGWNIGGPALGRDRNQIVISPLAHVHMAVKALRSGIIELEDAPLYVSTALRDTIAHELAHQYERSHGPRFEEFVARARDQIETAGIASVRALAEALGRMYDRLAEDYESVERTALVSGRIAVPEPLGPRPEDRIVVPAGRIQPPGGAPGGAERGPRPGAPVPGGPAGLRRAFPRAGLGRGEPVARREPLDPTVLKDLVEVGGFYVEGGLREFGAWSERMARELGERVRPHLQAVWDEIQRQRGAGQDKGLVEIRPEAVAPPAETAPPGKTEPAPEEPPAAPVPPRAKLPPPPPEVPVDVPATIRRIRERVGKFVADVSAVRDRLLPEAEAVLAEAETIAETGTLALEARRPFRETVAPKPETFTKRISERQIADTQTALVALSRQYRELRREIDQAADPFSQNTARAVQNMLDQATAGLNAVAKEFREQRFAAGRQVKRFDRPVPGDVLDALKEAGVMADWLTKAKPRLPIYTNILRSLRQFGSLTQPERRQFVRDLVDAWRLNLFSVTSWTLDFVGNASEISMQVAGGVGRDVIQAVKGSPNIPSLQGLFRALKDRALHVGQPIQEAIEAGLGLTVGGERIQGGFRGALTGEAPGAFTTRTGVPSRLMDLLVGSPLYSKGVMDTGAKRLMATATIWRDAIEEANRQGLRGSARRDFYRRFMDDLPQLAVDHAMEAGQKAGFNRALSPFEERVAANIWVRLFGDVFARWPFQFTRTMGEWLGVNPTLFRDLKAGRASAEDVASWLVKTATGWGGLYLLNEALWDRVDFNSMEYIHEDGSRTRLSNRDPIPTALWLLAAIKGDEAKFSGALRYASVPGARLLSEPGLLGGLLARMKTAIENADVDARALSRELTSTVNRMIPGQALLSAIETIFDPVLREGIGANVPGVSSFLEPVIQRTTGEPLTPRQKIIGVELPAIGGAPIPGAQRLIDPVERLLSRYGLLVYRGPRTPIAGLHPSDVPPEVLREWVVEFGRNRQRLLGPLAERMDRGEFARQNPDQIRKRIGARDSLAATLATNAINKRYGTLKKLPRRPTIRERRGPEVFEREREEAIGAAR